MRKFNIYFLTTNKRFYIHFLPLYDVPFETELSLGFKHTFHPTFLSCISKKQGSNIKSHSWLHSFLFIWVVSKYNIHLRTHTQPCGKKDVGKEGLTSSFQSFTQDHSILEPSFTIHYIQKNAPDTTSTCAFPKIRQLSLLFLVLSEDLLVLKLPHNSVSIEVSYHR